MITVYLNGGLSNQMFNYAAARALAVKYQTEVRLDLRWFDQEFGPGSTQRFYELEAFTFPRRTYRASKIERFLQRQNVLPVFRENNFNVVTGVSDSINYDPSFESVPDGARLYGYFHSYKYFQNIEDIIRQDFEWVKPARGKNKKLLDKIIADRSSVSVHIRRGDYVHHPVMAKVHGALSINYYMEALGLVKKSIKNPHLYVISDDPDWCKQHIKLPAPTTYVDHNSDGTEDMRLMKSCRHNILANSSFSWWSAWLNTNPKKIIVAPKQWQADSKQTFNDLIPPNWHRL